MNKKGQSFLDVFVLMVIVFFMLVAFAVLMFGTRAVYNGVASAAMKSDTRIYNLTDINNKTLGNLDAAFKQLRLISFVVIFGMILMIFLSNYLIKANPIFFIFYVLMAVIAVVISAVISNAYTSLLSNATIGTYLLDMKEGSFFMTYLPIFITIISLGGLLFLIIGTLKDTGQGGGLA